ncbi:cholinesterase 1 isoform X2 [Patella vulgata]|uniref:cholinesterase 1 isoform X2 n=1 Tax=Patella vulgata TaxID=6465 RepID=UPI0024A8D85F|nr:cholinesterase 1 isoform X2 [Patella vulgata]
MGRLKILIAFLQAFLTFVRVQAQPAILTTHGRVEGFRQTVMDIDVDTYYGIPFALPPVGDLRFQPPVDVRPWNDTRNATTRHNSCHAVIDTAFGRRKGVEMWNPNTPMSEDCLYLNVWMPRGVSLSTNKPMATMVWIFGGGFWAGTPTLDVYDAKYLAAFNDVIVVSINYRTGPLGFLYLGTQDIPGNMGLLDQQLALRWVFQNVENFGGDKSMITLFGESAGAASIGLHLFSPGSKDYFSRIILQSGSPLADWVLMPNNEAEERARMFSSSVGCDVTDKVAAFNCLLTKDASVLTEGQWNVVEGGLLDVPFPPVVDREFLMDEPRKLLATGDYKQTDVLMGVVKDEGSYWLLYGLQQYFGLENNTTLTRSDFMTCLNTLLFGMGEKVKEGVASFYVDGVPPVLRDSYRDILDDISGDNVFKCPVIEFGNIISNRSNVYLFTFNERVDSLPWPEWMGVPHGYEIEVVFGHPLNPALQYTPSEIELSKKTMKYWTNFAKTGDPNGLNLAVWPRYNVTSQDYVILDSSTTNYIQHGLRTSRCSFWSSIVPLIQNTGL